MTYNSFKRAIDLYQQATHHDENYANAYGREGICYMKLVSLFNVDRDEVDDAAKAAFHRARSLGFDPLSLNVWAGERFTWTRIDWFLSHRVQPELDGRTKRRNELELAIDLITDPTDPRNTGDPLNGYHLVSKLLDILLLPTARLEVLKCLHREGSDVQYLLGDTLDKLRRYEEAIAYYTTALKQNSNHHHSRIARALDYARMGQISKAEGDLAIIDKTYPKKSWSRFLHPYWLGELEQARHYFADMASNPRFEFRLKVVGWIMLSEFEQALDLLESREADGQPRTFGPRLLQLYAPQHIIDEIEQEPRYQSWLANAGLDSAMRQEAIDKLDQISDITGISVKLDRAY
jgi:tetratricopeptide (TPR) repeat protein|tara:strand:- start:50425 stop:51468 length:1044 start_codon:yes stop_codon:yes gene_type:complete